MKNLILLICLASSILKAQTIHDCRYRFNQYLNYRGQLSDLVVMNEKSIVLRNNNGSAAITIYKEELAVLGAYLESCSSTEISNFIFWKRNRILKTNQTDSLRKLTALRNQKKIKDVKTLKGVKIAIDPGHFGTNLKDAAAEQKFLKIINENSADTILIFESLLAFNTAALTKLYLEEQGAEVFLTRTQADFTSFNCTFDDWLKLHKQRTLDSLLKVGQINSGKYKQLKSCTNYQFFWDFFREFELNNRAKKINDYQPNLTLIIHYNVNEKNAPWKKTTDKNFTMTFIPGAFTRSDLNKADHKANFIRLLLSNQLNQCEKLAALTVDHFSAQLNIPKAKASDATYLKDNCLSAPAEGVYSRNLFLCRKVNSVLVYGESLYQDNEHEIQLLRKSDLSVNGILTNQRVKQVAKCYFDAVMDYYK
jgi:N-acetylmuramoyl-L-alanine amidase